MKFNREAIDVSEALRRIKSTVKEGSIESVDLLQSFGRTLAEQVTAEHHIPHFPRSGMDGFAIYAEDTVGASFDPVRLEVIETIPCGTVPVKRVERGQAARIMTGSVVPSGANAVIKFEWTETTKHNGKTVVLIKRAVNAGDNITSIGSEIQKGSLLLDRGRTIASGEAAILASFGYKTVKVYKQSKVAIIATGSELLDIGEALQPGKIRNSNSIMLAALIKEAGGIPVIFDQLSDDLPTLKEVVTQALSEAVVVLTTGGVSVGDYDILTDFFAEKEGNQLFNKVAMRPGSPTTVGVFDNKLLFALSGNPGACFAGFKLFVQPALRRLQGQPLTHPSEFKAYLAADINNPSTYQRFVRASTYAEEGKIYVKPVGKDKSSIMVSIKDTDSFIVVPPGSKELQRGDIVSVIALRE